MSSKGVVECSPSASTSSAAGPAVTRDALRLAPSRRLKRRILSHGTRGDEDTAAEDYKVQGGRAGNDKGSDSGEVGRVGKVGGRDKGLHDAEGRVVSLELEKRPVKTGRRTSLMERGLAQRVKKDGEPALSFVPEPRAPPKGSVKGMKSQSHVGARDVRHTRRRAATHAVRRRHRSTCPGDGQRNRVSPCVHGEGARLARRTLM